MMKKIVIFLLIACNLSLYAQTTDTRGTDFWLTFGCNYGLGYMKPALQIRIVGGKKDAKVTLHYTALGSSEEFTVAAHSVYSYGVEFPDVKKVVYNEKTGISKFSIHITSSALVSVYAINMTENTTDATNVLPLKALGSDYYCISYEVMGNGLDTRLLDAYAVIATQDNTQIRHNHEPAMTLQKGEVYYRTSGTDMTGTHITADKPIALFSMHRGPLIPFGFSSTDNLFQQLAPVSTWGKKFFVPVSWRGKDIVRIVASQNGTVITQTGGKEVVSPFPDAPTTYTLNAGQFAEFMVPLSNNGCYITANKPIEVCAYLTGESYNGNRSMGAREYDSDPAQTWVPPLEQAIDSALIAPFIPAGSSVLNAHYALIITAITTKNNTRVSVNGGAPEALNGGQWYDNSAAGMSFYSLPLSSNSTSNYIFTNTAGITVMAYGTGETESYYYLAAAAMRTLDVAFYVNDIYYRELDSKFLCTQPIQFRAELDMDNVSNKPGFLKWYIDGIEEVAAQDLLNWEKNLPNGVYRVKIEVLMADDEAIRTEEADLTIGTPEISEELENLIFCSSDSSVAISVMGRFMSESFSTWEVIEGVGTAIGMNANSGTLPIPAFIAENNSSYPDSVKIRITPIAANGCVGEPKTFTITVNPQFYLDQPEDYHICTNETVSISFTGINVDESIWEVTEGAWQDIGMSSANGMGSIPTFTADNTNDFIQSVTITVAPKYPTTCGGEAKTFTITVYPQKPLELNLGNDTTICKADSLLLKAGHPNATSYQWQDNFTGSTYIVYKHAGQFWVVISNECHKAKDTINISLLKDLQVNLGKNVAFCEDENIYKILDVTNVNASYLWQDGSTSPVYIVEQPDIYAVTVSNICTSVSSSVEITIKDCRELELWISNSFTPNGDGLNDIFKPEINSPELLKEYEMKIYNRWGELVFISTDFQTGWNGKNQKNKDCPPEIYSVIFKYASNGEKYIIKKTSVTLIR